MATKSPQAARIDALLKNIPLTEDEIEATVGTPGLIRDIRSGKRKLQGDFTAALLKMADKPLSAKEPPTNTPAPPSAQVAKEDTDEVHIRRPLVPSFL